MNGFDFRIPLRTIEASYGPGNFDDAGDDIVLALRRATGSAERSCRFEFDVAHRNPWHHALVFSVDRLTDAEYAAFEAALAGLFKED